MSWVFAYSNVSALLAQSGKTQLTLMSVSFVFALINSQMSFFYECSFCEYECAWCAHSYTKNHGKQSIFVAIELHGAFGTTWHNHNFPYMVIFPGWMWVRVEFCPSTHECELSAKFVSAGALIRRPKGAALNSHSYSWVGKTQLWVEWTMPWLLLTTYNLKWLSK